MHGTGRSAVRRMNRRLILRCSAHAAQKVAHGTSSGRRSPARGRGRRSPTARLRCCGGVEIWCLKTALPHPTRASPISPRRASPTSQPHPTPSPQTVHLPHAPHALPTDTRRSIDVGDRPCLPFLSTPHFPELGRIGTQLGTHPRSLVCGRAPLLVPLPAVVTTRILS